DTGLYPVDSPSIILSTLVPNIVTITSSIITSMNVASILESLLMYFNLSGVPTYLRIIEITTITKTSAPKKSCVNVTTLYRGPRNANEKSGKNPSMNPSSTTIPNTRNPQ